MKRVKIEGLEAPPKVTATLELEEDPEIFDLSSGSRYDHFPTSYGVLKQKYVFLTFYMAGHCTLLVLFKTQKWVQS